MAARRRHYDNPLFREEVFKIIAIMTGKVPSTLITDGLRSYHVAFKKVYGWRNYPNHPVHVKEITLAGKIHNNKMERMNGEVRDREKVMRSLKTMDSPIFEGLQLYHNYFRPHMALKGKTPAEAAGITIEGENKWETVIGNAACGHLPNVDKEEVSR